LPIYVRFTTSYTKGIPEIASALTARVILVVVDWKRLLGSEKLESFIFLKTESLLKVRGQVL